MKKLEPHIRKNGFDYYLIDRDDHCALYEQIAEDHTGEKFSVAFEVFEIKVTKEGKIGSRIIEGGEKFPGNEAFGNYAWCYTCSNGANRDEGLRWAQARYQQLQTKFKTI